MIFGKNAGLMLKYQKAKAKMVEYDVSKQEYPHFPLNSNELSYPTTYVLSRYSECIIENNHDELKELELLLITTAEYYDSAFKSKDRPEYDWDFLLSGASAYFLRKDFGSAKVLAARVVDLIDEERSPQKLLTNIYNYLLGGVYLPYLRVIDTYERINNFFLDYFGKGKSLEALKSNLWVYRNEIYENGDPDSIFYVDILVAVIIVACENSSWSLLPSSSGILDEEWESYLQSKMSIKMLWPAQRLIAEKGLLRGESSIVQLPTGVGKTRSIELIIRAAFLSERANIAIIVAPLRALCNEITMDMWLAMAIAAYCTNGKELPNALPIEPFNVLYQTAEDGIADTIKPRLAKCGADMTRVRFINEDEKQLSMTDDRIEKAIRQNSVRLMIMDPIQAYLGANVDMNRANEIRPLFRHLSTIAERTGCAIVLIGHLNKSSGSQSDYRSLGSIDIAAAVRSILFVEKVEKEKEQDIRVVYQQKDSLAKKENPVAFSLGEEGLKWLGEYDISIEDLLMGKAGTKKETKLEKAQKLILELLTKRKVMCLEELEAELLAYGISSRTGRDARKQLENRLSYDWCQGRKTVALTTE